MILLFDIGNTYAKWASCENGTISEVERFIYAQNIVEPELMTIAERIERPADIGIACVAENRHAEHFTGIINKLWQIEPWFAKVEERTCGVSNAYADIRQLGIDRWLALIGAWNTYKKPLCVIDCGTAITADMIGPDGGHIGGFIIPGLTMMQESLSSNTARIDINISQSFALVPGKSAQGCISNGCAFAIIGFIEQIIKQAGFGIGDELEYILTGGDAKCIGQYLPHDHHYDQKLILKGLSMLMENR